MYIRSTNRARFGWIRKNVVKTLPSFGGWRKHIIGAINLQDFKIVTTDNPKVHGPLLLSSDAAL